jgi:hypothetical protein
LEDEEDLSRIAVAMEARGGHATGVGADADADECRWVWRARF